MANKKHTLFIMYLLMLKEHHRVSRTCQLAVEVNKNFFPLKNHSEGIAQDLLLKYHVSGLPLNLKTNKKINSETQNFMEAAANIMFSLSSTVEC